MNIRIPPDQSNYKAKWMLGLEPQQFTTLAIAIGVGLLIGILGSVANINFIIVSWMIIPCSGLIVAIGFYKPHGMSLKEYMILNEKFQERQGVVYPYESDTGYFVEIEKQFDDYLNRYDYLDKKGKKELEKKIMKELNRSENSMLWKGEN